MKITVIDSDGNTFSREWKDSASKVDAIRWTIQSGDIEHSLYVEKIIEVKVEQKSCKKQGMLV